MIERRVCVRLVHAVSLVCGLLLLAGLPGLTLAAPSALPPRPTPLPTPTSTPIPEAPAQPEPLVGGFIELHVRAVQVPAGVWTVVRWQDAFGGWHDVKGWQGTLDAGDQKVWWVADKDFSTGPFRWVVYQGQGGPSLVASESFYLPAVSGERVRVEVSLGP